MFFLEVLACIVIADFLTGLVHWWEDTYSVPSWPVLGKLVAIPNIEHHKLPKLMGQRGNWWTRCRLSFIFTGIFMIPFVICNAVSWQLCLVALLTALGNQVHAWHHGANHDNKIIRFFQKKKIIQTPNHHGIHHREPFDNHYCILTNFLNPVLDKLMFWRGLEIFFNFFGIKVKRMSQERSYV